MNIKCSPFCFFLGMGIVLAMWGMCEWMKPTPCPKPQSFPERPPEREIERHTREETIAWLKRIYGTADFEAAMKWIESLESSMQECRWCNQAQSYYWRAR